MIDTRVHTYVTIVTVSTITNKEVVGRMYRSKGGGWDELSSVETKAIQTFFFSSGTH